MKVLAGIDGSNRSFNALKFASQILSPKVDDITLYYSPPEFKLTTESKLAEDIPAFARTALVETVFGKGKETLPQEFAAVTQTIIGEESPAKGVLAAADNSKADLVVIGAHSANRILPLKFGGNARKIAHQCRRPVLVHRDKEEKKTKSFNVLVACDESGRWCHAADVLKEFSWPDETTATLLHVVEVMIDDGRYDSLPEDASTKIPEFPSLLEEYRAVLAQERAKKLAHFRECRDKLTGRFCEADVKVTSGHVVERIVKEVHDSDIDLVVVGARKLGPMGRLFSSTTESLLYQCPCSMLVVHETDKA